MRRVPVTMLELVPWIKVHPLFSGPAVFLAVLGNVMMQTLRSACMAHGYRNVAFFVHCLEMFFWFTIVSAVLALVAGRPSLVFFHVAGTAAGLVAGTWLDSIFSIGKVALRAITTRDGAAWMTRSLRRRGFGVTTFDGEGLAGGVVLVYVVCRKKDEPDVIAVIRTIDKDCFLLTEPVARVEMSGPLRKTAWINKEVHGD